MAAVLEIDESNGSPEVVTHNIAQSNYGAVDAVNLNASANPIIPGANSFEKWQKWHVTAMGGAVSVRAFRFFATSPASNTTHHFNGSTVQATYDSANHKQTVYAVPATNATRTPETVPTSAPATGNIGIAGSLTGELLATGSSDFLVSQIRTGSPATAGTTVTLSYRYDEIAIFLIGLFGVFTAMI
jgi:hypothetical protein